MRRATSQGPVEQWKKTSDHYVILTLRGDRVHEAYCDPEGKVLDEFEFGQSA